MRRQKRFFHKKNLYATRREKPENPTVSENLVKKKEERKETEAKRQKAFDQSDQISQENKNK